MSILTKIFGDAQEKYFKKLQPLVAQINSLEPEFERFSNEELKEKLNSLKEKLKQGETLDALLPEVFALVRESGKRTLGQRHFDVQLLGGIILHQGKIAEMKTGEGKTLAATLPVALNALAGKGVHIVTVNDYLAKRDTVWMGQIYHLLGLSVGCIVHEGAYLYDPTYNEENPKSEILNLYPPKFSKKTLAGEQIQNPRLRQGYGGQAKSKIQNNERDKERDIVGGFKVIESYLKPCPRKEAYLADITYGTNNEFGFDYLRDNLVYDLKDRVQSRPERASLASQSEAGDFHYVIVDEIDSILIDEARTPLIISAQDTESSTWYKEFAKIIPKLNQETDYELDEKLRVATLTEPGIEKIERILGQDIYQEKGIRYVHHLEQALRAEVLFKRDKDYVVKDGQVIIIDEFTGRLLPGRRYSGGLHQALEAKEAVQVQPESLTLASITFQNYFRMYKKLAGMTGTALTSAEEFDKVYGLDAVAVPTNKPMRRDDLSDKIFKSEREKCEAVVQEIKERNKLGQPILVGTRSVEKNEYLGKLLEREGISHQILNAKNHEKEGEIIAQAGNLGSVTVATNMAGRGVDIILGGNPQDQKEAEKVRELGGLYVIGTERHEARRIDNQLRGRTGRQGDPGSSQFFLSLEDDLLRIFGGEKIKSLLEKLKAPEGMPIELGLVSRAIESAQSKIEGLNFDLRKHVLEYDDVLNKHREVIYRKRKEFLTIDNWESIIEDYIKNTGDKKIFEEKRKELGENFNQVAKILSLRILDSLWQEHLENMEHLRDSVRLRAYGQQDPLVEYKREGHKLFQQLLTNFEITLANTILRVSVKPAGQPQAGPSIQSGSIIAPKQKIGRNDPCPCGAVNPQTGRPYKYKHCGLINAPHHGIT